MRTVNTFEIKDNGPFLIAAVFLIDEGSIVKSTGCNHSFIFRQGNTRRQALCGRQPKFAIFGDLMKKVCDMPEYGG
jgi:hypothetical protein